MITSFVSEGIDFGHALAAVKAGKRAARAGWNGKSMFIYLNRGSVDFSAIKGVPQPTEKTVTHIEGLPVSLFEKGDIGTATRLPNLNMSTPTGSTVTGWLVSQTDMLATDWVILD